MVLLCGFFYKFPITPLSRPSYPGAFWITVTRNAPIFYNYLWHSNIQEDNVLPDLKKQTEKIIDYSQTTNNQSSTRTVCVPACSCSRLYIALVSGHSGRHCLIRHYQRSKNADLFPHRHRIPEIAAVAVKGHHVHPRHKHLLKDCRQQVFPCMNLFWRSPSS